MWLLLFGAGDTSGVIPSTPLPIVRSALRAIGARVNVSPGADAVECFANTPLSLAFKITTSDARLFEVPADSTMIAAGDLTLVVSLNQNGTPLAHAGLSKALTYVAAQQEWRADFVAADMASTVWNALAAPIYLVLLYQGSAIGYAVAAYSQYRDMLTEGDD